MLTSLLGAIALRLLALALLAAVAWAAGVAASPAALRGGQSGRPVPWGWTLALGMAVLAQALFLLGLAGWLRAPAVVGLAAALLAAGLWRGRRAGSALPTIPRRAGPGLAAVAAVALAAFALALYPPLGHDQTMYHLPFARAFAETGGLPFLPALRFPAFPVLAEVLNCAVLLLADDVATQTTGLCALAACAGLIYAWARERTSAAGGWVAVAILAGSPLALYLATTGYVEPLLALFGLAALYAADRARSAERSEIWALAAGALAGSAAGVKYPGLYFVAASALLLLRRAGGWRANARDLALCGLAAGLAAAPTYGRLLALTGNPLFPFFPEMFGANPWAVERFLGARGSERLVRAATLLWDLTFRREALGTMPPFSPGLVLGAPLALLAAWRDAAHRRLLLVAAGFVLFAQVHAHYFLAIAPVWCVAIGTAAARLAQGRTRARRLLTAVALALALGGVAYALFRVHRLGPPPTTAAARDRLLAAQRPLYPAVTFLNRTAGPVTAYSYSATTLVYFAAGTLLGDHNGPASYDRVAERVRANGSLAGALDELGASYLILPNSAAAWLELTVRDPRLERVFQDEAASVFRVLAGGGGPPPAEPVRGP